MKNGLHRLWKYSGKYRYIMILLPFVLLAQVALEVWVPYLMGDMMDRGIYAKSMNVIMKQGVQMALASVGMMITGLLTSRLISLWAAGVTRNVRDSLFQQVQKLAFTDTDEYGTAAILTRMSVDINHMKKGLGMFHSLLRSPMMVIVTVVVTLKAYPQASWIFLLGAGGFVVVNIFVVNFAIRHYRLMFRRYDEVNEKLEENVTAQKTVKAYARESYEQEQFEKSADRLRKEARIAEGVTMLNEPLLNLVLDICIMGIILYSCGAIVRGSLQAGDYFCLITYANQILFQISMVALIMVPILNAQVSMERIFEVAEKEPSICDGAESEKMVKDGAVSFKDVSLNYYQEKNPSEGKESPYVLQDINLDIRPGEFIGVIGSSGSGKSSLINLIPRFYDTSQGHVEVGGENVRDYSLKHLREAIGLVPQHSLLFSGTIADNLKWGNEEATPEELVKAASIAGANDFVMSFPDGYKTHISQGGTTVSGGQRQRLCIARALVKKPKILIFDDSLSAVDNTTEAGILKSLSEELQDTTVILVSQRFSSVKNADRILVLNRGKIEAVGTHEQLIEESRVYREIYETQRRMME